jgi:hypothetical protein
MAGENIKVHRPIMTIEWHGGMVSEMDLLQHFKQMTARKTFAKPHHLDRIQAGYTILERIRDWFRYND